WVMMPLRVMLAGFSILALTVQAVGADLAPEPITHAAMTQAAIEKHIIPHIDELKAAAKPLPEAAAAVCKTGSPEAQKDLEQTFEKIVIAYASVDFLRFGPMAEKGRREQISFWPDPRGFVGRQLRLLLLAKDENIAQPGAIGKQSAAVQGLSALEV